MNFNPNKLRVVLQALRNLYTADCNLYFSVENGQFLFESAGGLHRFQISFDVDGVGEVELQKTTIGAFTQHLQLLNEYPDLVVTGGFIKSNNGVTTIRVNKQYKESNNDPVDAVSLTKVLSVSLISDVEREALTKSKESFVGDPVFNCPSSIGVAAAKAHLLHAEAMYLRGKYVYCASGEGVCRVVAEELSEDLIQNIDTEFMFGLSKLGADQYQFYEDYVTCEVAGVLFKLGIPRKFEARPINSSVLTLFDSVEPDIRVYCKAVRTLYGKGDIIISENTLSVNEHKKIGAPFILPLKAQNKAAIVTELVSKVAGDVWTLGIMPYKGESVAYVSGDCDIVFTVRA